MPYKDKAKGIAYKRSWNKRFYLENKEKEKARILNRKKKMAQWLLEYKSEKSCQICRENTVICLDFHHRNASEKDRNLSDAVLNRGWGFKRLEEEIAKCVILCSNCHRKVHVGIISIS